MGHCITKWRSVPLLCSELSQWPLKRVTHRVYGVPGFLSSRPNWLPPPHHQQASVAYPFGSKGGRHTRLRERGRGGGQIGRRDTLVLQVWYNPSTGTLPVLRITSNFTEAGKYLHTKAAKHYSLMRLFFSVNYTSFLGSLQRGEGWPYWARQTQV